ARPAHGRAGAALAGAGARVAARSRGRDGDPLPGHAHPPGTGDLKRAPDGQSRARLQLDCSSFSSARANGPGSPESTSVSPVASRIASSGSTTAPEARRKETTVTPPAGRP